MVVHNWINYCIKYLCMCPIYHAINDVPQLLPLFIFAFWHRHSLIEVNVVFVEVSKGREKGGVIDKILDAKVFWANLPHTTKPKN